MQRLAARPGGPAQYLAPVGQPCSHHAGKLTRSEQLGSGRTAQIHLAPRGQARVTVSRYVARRRAEIGLDHVDVAVPQAHLPGAEAEVDFGEFHVMIAGCW
jgi:hypothetical protein